MKPADLRSFAVMLNELGLSYAEFLDAMHGTARELHLTRRLWGEEDKKLIKLGLAMIAFPEPTPISETLGAITLSIGILRAKMRKSTLQIEDVYTVFQKVIRNLQGIRREILLANSINDYGSITYSQRSEAP